MSFFVYNGRFAVEYIGKLGSGDGVYHQLQGIVFVKFIAGIEKTEIVARSQADSLVHGIIQAFVRFADQGMDVLAITVDDVQSVVFGTSVYNDVFHIPVGLGNDTLDGVFQHGTGVVRHGDDGELGMNVVMHCFRLSDYKS